MRLDVTRDAWVSDVGQEADGNNGGATRLKIKSIQEMTLVDIDPRPLVGMTIRSATLHLKKAGDEPVKRVTTSGVGAEWFEGTGSGYAIQAGGVTFRHRRHPDLPWSIGGGDLTHVVLGNGGTTWRMSDATPPDRDDWQRVPIDPRVVATRVAGLSYGFLVFDDTGTEWTRSGEKFTRRIFPNRFVYSREENRSSAPYITVEPGPDDGQPPLAPSGLRIEPATAQSPPGEALVSWVTPQDDGPAGTLGFFATIDGREVPRELIPLAGEPGARVQMHLRDLKLTAGKTISLSVRAVDAAGNLGPGQTIRVPVSNSDPVRLPQPKTTSSPQRHTPAAPWFRRDRHHRRTRQSSSRHGRAHSRGAPGLLGRNHLWDAADPKITLQAARNEFVAFQLLIRSPRPSMRQRSSPNWSSTARPAKPSRSSWAVIIRSQPSSARSPTRSCR